MKNEFKFIAKDKTQIHVYYWGLDDSTTAKGVVQIAHGMAEHAQRYERFALALNKAGYCVYANDHRGHGKSVAADDKLGIFADDEGFNRLVGDMYQLTEIIREKHSDLPIHLFGHSMGSFAAQRYIQLHSKAIDSVILCGSNGKNPKLLGMYALFTANREVKKHGRLYFSIKLDKLMMGRNNKPFEPARTAFDWLSQDQKEVDKYIADPHCGFVLSAGAAQDFIKELLVLEEPKEVAKVGKDLPIFIISGEKDVVGHFGKGVKKLYQTYQSHGIRDVQMKLYPKARHELLNELNRDQVTADVISWLNQTKTGEQNG